MCSDTDVSDHESSSKHRLNIANVPFESNINDQEPEEQSVWGQRVPYNVLHCIFNKLCVQEGGLPLLVR